MQKNIGQPKRRVGMIGSGCWGSAMATIIGQNVLENPERFEPEVLMYVYEEIVNGEKLTDIINTRHENVKYLPETILPANIVAVPDVMKACGNADILVFVLPHQFVEETCRKIKNGSKRTALAVSLIKGFVVPGDERGFQLVSKVIHDTIGLNVAVVSGANLAVECACEMFCETTIAVENPSYDKVLRTLFQTSFLRCRIVRNVAAVEACGAIKNVIGIGAGLIDGLGFGDNTKSLVLRLGLQEMMSFIKIYFQAMEWEPYIKEPFDNIFLESCGIADLIATCQGGRNRLLGEAIIKSMKKRGMAGVDIRMLEKEIIRGQSFQGPIVAAEIYKFLKRNQLVGSYPLLVSIHRICTREIDPRNFIDCLRDHPDHAQTPE